MAAFSGFRDETTGFYLGLEADNSRAYWQDHKDVYERAVREPMLALTAALEPRFGRAKLFRPHRDLRFGTDKTPYKTHQGAVVAHPDGGGSWYLQVGADGLMVGGGLWQPARDQLARYRAAVAAATGAGLARTLDALVAGGWELIGDVLTRAPRGFDPDHPRIGLLRHRSIALRVDHGDPDWFTEPACLDRVAEGWQALEPFLGWLGTHVGPARADA